MFKRHNDAFHARLCALNHAVAGCAVPLDVYLLVAVAGPRRVAAAHVVRFEPVLSEHTRG
jgi:hypothetical protein